MRGNDGPGEFLDVRDALVRHAAATVASGLMQRQPTIEKHR
jgi:hypothetical protein